MISLLFLVWIQVIRASNEIDNYPYDHKFSINSFHHPSVNDRSKIHVIDNYITIKDAIFEHLRETETGGAFSILEHSLHLRITQTSFFDCEARECGGGAFEGKSALISYVCGSHCKANFCQFVYINNTEVQFRTDLNSSSIYRCCPNEDRVTDCGGICGFIGSQYMIDVNQSNNCMNGGPTCFYYKSNKILIRHSCFTQCYGSLHGMIHPFIANSNNSALYDRINFCNQTYYGNPKNSMLHTHRMNLYIRDSRFKHNVWRYFYIYQCNVYLSGCIFDRSTDGIVCNRLITGDSVFNAHDVKTYDYNMFNSKPCEVNLGDPVSDVISTRKLKSFSWLKILFILLVVNA